MGSGLTFLPAKINKDQTSQGYKLVVIGINWFEPAKIGFGVFLILANFRRFW